MRYRFMAVVMALGLAAGAQVLTPDVAGLAWRSIGPASTGGRIADFAVAEVPGEPEVMYVGTASGGVFKSTNAGVSWTPIFDHAAEGTHQAMLSIGAVAVAPSNPDIVWVGTGEVDNRQSSSWGNGIYRSSDGGATWTYMGLEQTRHIAKIIVDPANADIVYVAALGHLWGSNPERGVYKTTDGGATWTKVLYVDDNTGATDLAMSPANPHLLFAAMYQRQRKGWGFNGGGPGSGIYRSSDGGATWTKLTKGLPDGDKGRIGVALTPQDPRRVYAIIEADPAGTPPNQRVGGIYASQDQGQSWQHLSDLDPRPMYYSRIYVDPKDSNRVYIMGSERGFYISDDGGRNFRDVFSEVHGEDHAMWIDPREPNHLLIGGDGGVSISYDRGLTWSFRNDMPIGQFYNISMNQASPYLVCGGLQDNGNWCVPSATHVSLGIANGDSFNIGGGDGMQAVFDGDNTTLLVSSQNGSTTRLELGDFDRQSIGPVPPPNPPTPGQPPLYRWNWTAPLLVSPQDAKTIYTGANVLFRSPDQGRTWQVISPDLTAHVDRDKLEMMGAPVGPKALSRNDGQDNFSALTAVALSPLDAKLIYTGADDGTFERTRSGGGTAAADWSNLTGKFPGLPAMTQVSGIVASRYAPGRVYATFDGHFNDDYHPYVYVSDDYGDTWRSLAAGLPETSVHRLRESPTNPDFLVIGTETGVFATWDRGQHWTSLDTNLPPVPVYDLRFQSTTGDLVLGTHGRGIWVLDDAAPLEALTPEVRAAAARLLPARAAALERRYTPQAWYGAGEFFAPNPPDGALLWYYLGAGAGRRATITITSHGQTIRTLRVPAHAGLNRAVWDLRYDAPQPPAAGGRRPAAGRGAGPGAGGGGGGFFRRAAVGPLVEPGPYTVTLEAGGAPQTETLTVTGTPSPRPRLDALMKAYHLQQQIAQVQASANQLSDQLEAMRAYLTAMKPASGAASAALSGAETALGAVQRDLGQAAGQAAAAERGMDSYPGLPSASQLQQLDWAGQDARRGVSAYNALVRRGMAPVYAAVGAARFAPLPPVPEIQ